MEPYSQVVLIRVKISQIETYFHNKVLQMSLQNKLFTIGQAWEATLKAYFHPKLRTRDNLLMEEVAQMLLIILLSIQTLRIKFQVVQAQEEVSLKKCLSRQNLVISSLKIFQQEDMTVSIKSQVKLNLMMPKSSLRNLISKIINNHDKMP